MTIHSISLREAFKKKSVKRVTLIGLELPYLNSDIKNSEIS